MNKPTLSLPDTHRWTVLALAVAALAYPWLLRVAYEAGRWHAAVALPVLGLCLAVPMGALGVAVRLSGLPEATPGAAFARALSHGVFASAPLYTFLGVILYAVGSELDDFLVWTVFWAFLVVLGSMAVPTLRSLSVSSALRMAHGMTAAVLLAAFLAAHLANHLAGAWSVETHAAVMKWLRVWYRNGLVEPLLAGLVVFQAASGAWLLRARLSRPADAFATLQTATGVLLLVFIASHLNAVFILARQVLAIDSDSRFVFTAGGLLADPWTVRLIPHYGLAVWSLVTHAACGLRTVLLSHGARPSAADRLTIALSAVGAALAAVIVLALCRVHIA